MLKPDKLSRIEYAQKLGWKHIDEERMEGIPPVGPYQYKPLPVEGLSPSNPHYHCSQCWAELKENLGQCPVCGTPLVIWCLPDFCGSS